MRISSLVKNKKFQVFSIVVLVAAVILFSLLTDFPEGDTQGALRNKRFGPTIQSPQNQSQQQIPIQQYQVPTQNIDMPTGDYLIPTTNNIDMPTGGY